MGNEKWEMGNGKRLMGKLNVLNIYVKLHLTNKVSARTDFT